MSQWLVIFTVPFSVLLQVVPSVSMWVLRAYTAVSRGSTGMSSANYDVH